MAKLFDKLQDYIIVGEKQYKIPTDFKQCINLFVAMDEQDTEYIMEFINQNNLPISRIDEVIQALVTFLTGEEENSPVKGETNQASQKEKALDYKADASLIFTSFFLDYGIDLYKQDLHWHIFLQMLANLSDKSPLMKAVHFRTVDISKVPKEQRDYYKAMKATYSLDKKKQNPMTAEEQHQQWKERVKKAYERAENEIKRGGENV